MQNKKLRNTLYLTILAVISFILMYLLEVPLIPSAPFLKYDLSEVVAILAGFIFGPLAGSVVVMIKSVLFFLSGKNTSGWVGLLASALAGLSMVLGTTLLYRFKKNNISLFVGVILGTAALVVVMSFFNYFFLLGWYGIPADQYGAMMVPIVLFNLIKGLLSSVISVAVYRLIKTRIEKVLAKQA